MPPRLRVLAGPSIDEMEPISCNKNVAHRISSPFFDGAIIVHIKGFPDESGNVLDSEYFSREDRKGVTWSIQVQGTFATSLRLRALYSGLVCCNLGRFLQTYSADEIMFGNTFDRPLRLPWGSSAALKFMK
jgi:hypothetical protein